MTTKNALVVTFELPAILYQQITHAIGKANLTEYGNHSIAIKADTDEKTEIILSLLSIWVEQMDRDDKTLNPALYDRDKIKNYE